MAHTHVTCSLKEHVMYVCMAQYCHGQNHFAFFSWAARVLWV